MCVSVQVFQLSGWLEEFALRDSTFVLVNHPANPFDSPQPDVLYVDISTPAKALEAISRLFKYSFHLWPRKGLERVKIQSSLSPTVQRVTIRGILDYEVVAPSHADEKKLDVDLQENLYPWLQKPEQWLVREVTWKRNSEKTSYMGTNSIFATIESPRLVGSVNPVHPPPCSRGQRSDTNNVHFFARESFGFDYAQLHEYDTN